MAKLFGTRLSPFVDKVARALYIKKIDFEMVPITGPGDFKKWSPQTSKMPVLELDGERTYDSTFILDRLDEIEPRPPLASADSELRALGRLTEDWADEALYWLLMALRWCPAHAAASTDQILSSVPSAVARTIVKLLVPRQLRAAVAAQGFGRLPPDVLVREMEARCDDLLGVLGDKGFLHSNELSRADLSVVAQLAMGLSGPTPEVEKALVARPVLQEYVDRVQQLTGG